MLKTALLVEDGFPNIIKNKKFETWVVQTEMELCNLFEFIEFLHPLFCWVSNADQVCKLQLLAESWGSKKFNFHFLKHSVVSKEFEEKFTKS